MTATHGNLPLLTVRQEPVVALWLTGIYLADGLFADAGFTTVLP